ncbi:MAG: peptide chain release factor N(5)-glutamine methyltransferase [Gemmatimonadota bacterium]|nr:peptide chain release factor N(5)-glutamine methyltransferase [Gemmatimonadota bacterium]
MSEAATHEHAANSVGALVNEVREVLHSARIEDAKTEARDLVAAVLEMPRLWPSTHRDELTETPARDAALAAARKRASGAPFAYAVGRAAFRHFVLEVDERVLIPRQETEVLVDAVLERMREGVAIDIGTGSGAIALALASEGAYERVIAIDVSLGALEVARTNARRLARGLRTPVEFRHGSLLAPVRGERARVIVSNPPYIAIGEAPELPSSVRDWEPPIALFSGADGMSITARIIRQAADVLERGGLLALELDSRRASAAAELALGCGMYTDVSVRLDLAGRERILLATRVAYHEASDSETTS